MKQKKFWPKLIGTVLLLHVILVVISILEVTIYSMAITPGKEKAFYENHATESGPWISAIFGSLLMFFFVKRYLKRFTEQHLTYAIGLPAIYLVVDLILIALSGYELQDYVYHIVLASVPKIIAVILAYNMYSKGNRGVQKSNAFR